MLGEALADARLSDARRRFRRRRPDHPGGLHRARQLSPDPQHRAAAGWRPRRPRFEAAPRGDNAGSRRRPWSTSISAAPPRISPCSASSRPGEITMLLDGRGAFQSALANPQRRDHRPRQRPLPADHRHHPYRLVGPACSSPAADRSTPALIAADVGRAQPGLAAAVPQRRQRQWLAGRDGLVPDRRPAAGLRLAAGTEYGPSSARRAAGAHRPFGIPSRRPP